MTAAKEMRHWNPEAHIGDDGYVLADVKAAVAEATAGTTDEHEMRRRGAKARRPAQRGAKRGGWGMLGHIFPWRCRISASPTRISAYGGKSSLSPIKLRKKHSKKPSTSSFSTSSSTISSPSTDSSPGATVKTLPGSDLLAEYVVERVLGRGSNGKVRLCRSTGSQELHALKAVRGSAAGSNQKRNRLNRKLSDAGRSSLHPPAPALGETISVSLQPHDNLLRVYEVILNDPLQPEGGAHVVMEAATGGDLTAANFRVEGVLDEARLAATMLGAARGLGHLHALGVVHGDIKLGNLLLGGPHGRTVKVADLGCASRFDPSTTPPFDWWVTNRPAGTPAYLAPEQTTEQPYLGPPADVWALGVCLFQLASGRLPFQANSIIGLYAAIAGHETSPVEDLVGTVSPELEDLLRRMLSKAHSDRISVPDMLEHAWLRQPAE
eukprot:jgi/Tetstr1/445914/TSEL_033543.t1